MGFVVGGGGGGDGGGGGGADVRMAGLAGKKVRQGISRYITRYIERERTKAARFWL